jgi:hypothetical protein
MSHVYTVFKEDLTGKLETLIQDVGKEEAFSLISKVTGYTPYCINKNYKTLSCLKIVNLWNRRNITIKCQKEE